MVVFHWLHTLWFGYTWPSLKGNGPEALVQTGAYAVLAYAFYPPFRAWVKREGTKLHDKIDLLHDKVDHGHDQLGLPPHPSRSDGGSVPGR